jgi:hypothetical protein
MSAHGHASPAEIRKNLKHPVIDGDGHWVEYDPVFAERMRKVGGDLAADGFLKTMDTTRQSLQMTVAERKRRRIAQPAFWSRQAENTLDRATAMMPRLLYDRLEEFGTDFAIVYPTAGLRLPRINDDATRKAVIRAYNIVSAEYFRDLSDRMTPAAIIPMHTPEEAIAELEFTTKQLGAKAGMFGSNMFRKVPSLTGSDPDLARFGVWYDVLGIDSDHDYDPVWATAPAATRDCGIRQPISSTTISAISRRPAMPPARACSWAASRGASRNCAGPSWKAASAGHRSCSAT